MEFYIYIALLYYITIVNIVLESVQDDLGGGYVGLEKTYQNIRSKYFWIIVTKITSL